MAASFFWSQNLTDFQKMDWIFDLLVDKNNLIYKTDKKVEQLFESMIEFVLMYLNNFKNKQFGKKYT